MTRLVPEYKRSLDCYYRRHQDVGFWRDKYPPHSTLYARRLWIRNNEVLKRVQGNRVLDLGCGLGDILSLLSHIPLAVGIDLSEIQLREAMRNLSGSRPLFVSPADELPFRGGFFDTVILADVIEHLPEPERSLREIRRVLCETGLLIITTPRAGIEQFWKRVDWTLNIFIRPSKNIRDVWHLLFEQNHQWISTYDNHFSPRGLRSIVTGCGYQILEHRYIEFYPGSEGGGFFDRGIMKNIYRLGKLREPLEKKLGTLFDLIERLSLLNNRQLLVAQKS